MDILGSLPKTLHGNLFIRVVEDRCSKLMSVIPTFNTSSTFMADIFLDNLIAPIDILRFVLADNGPQLVSNFFAMSCADLGVEHLTTRAYHSLANDQAERFDCTILTHLQNRVVYDQQDLDAFV